MGTTSTDGQLILFAPQARADTAERRRRARGRRRPGAGPGSRLRMAERLEALAEAAEREMRECRRAGDRMRERAARDRAAGARRAAQILRAEPGGIATIIDGSHPEAA